MYRNLFAAWYCLGVLVLCLVTFLILLPFIGPGRATGSFGVLGLVGFLPILPVALFRKEKYDERDISFLRHALFAGFCFGFSIMGPIVALQGAFYEFWLGRDSIPIAILGVPLHCGLCIGIFSFSVMLLRLYYKGGLTNE